MTSSIQILKQYWGYSAFRSPQDAIIESITSGKDTLVVLPTGGGKSICYQVPAMMQEGICIVVSPLIALMKDQVERLQKQGIKAQAIFSGLTAHEIDIALDNAAYSDIKMLYVSPERLETEIFRTRVQKMNVNLIAVDEAHCVSQWGYDFRPSYLKIAGLRELLPNVPLIALTASATLKVREDIAEQLQMKDVQTFTKSFARNNISFVTRKVENKAAKLLEVMSKLGGCGIVYVRSRKKTKQIADFLNENKYKSTFYHAGLTPEIRSERQEAWMKGETPIIVCTNAFGMGIDKPNVRFVIHWDVPESLEAYYQEAGRAGRDGKMSYAVLLFNKANITRLQNGAEQKFPDIATIKGIYNAICNHLKVAVHNGFMMTYDFDVMKFVQLFKLSILTTHNVIAILEQEGYWVTSQSIHLPSRLVFTMDKKNIYKFQVENEKYDKPIQLLLRTYGGILDHYTVISEQYMADRLKIKVEMLIQTLKKLKEKGVVNYVPYKNNPSLTFLKNRVPDKSLVLDRDFWIARKKLFEEKANAMADYCLAEDECKQIIIAKYFGEENGIPCGKCNVCIESKAKKMASAEFERIRQLILDKLEKEASLKLSNLLKDINFHEKQNYLKTLRQMLDEEEIRMGEGQTILIF
ncbi:MAG: ATP-dependent DNA helicase RecQ [Chitinophagales bacterium]